jgi:hypothetical protein
VPDGASFVTSAGRGWRGLLLAHADVPAVDLPDFTSALRVPAGAARHPQPVFTSESLEVPFSEGVFVGYKGYEREGARLQFPFGHGLSYTRFRYRGLSTWIRGRKAGDVRVRFTIRNVGRRTGREVAQVYVGPLPRACRCRRSCWPGSRR